jgi:hypothetical protein
MIVALHHKAQIAFASALSLEAFPGYGHRPPLRVHTPEISVDEGGSRRPISEFCIAAVFGDLGCERSGDAEVEIEKAALRGREDLDDVLNAGGNVPEPLGVLRSHELDAVVHRVDDRVAHRPKIVRPAAPGNG